MLLGIGGSCGMKTGCCACRTDLGILVGKIGVGVVVGLAQGMGVVVGLAQGLGVVVGLAQGLGVVICLAQDVGAVGGAVHGVLLIVPRGIFMPAFSMLGVVYHRYSRRGWGVLEHRRRRHGDVVPKH
eukprot:9456676-Ditylum_brightwellii.AAC.1